MSSIEDTGVSIEDWIDGATFTQVRVDIHRNPALWGELQPLYALIEAAEARLDEAQRRARPSAPDETLAGAEPPPEPVGEATLGGPAQVPASVLAAQADVDRLYDQAKALYDRYDLDKETWVIRGLDPVEAREVIENQGQPPTGPPRRQPDDDEDTWRLRSAQYVVAVNAWKLAIDEDALSRAVVEVIVGGERKPPPSVDGLRRLRARPHGERHWARLVEAMEALTRDEVVIPAPHR